MLVAAESTDTASLAAEAKKCRAPWNFDQECSAAQTVRTDPGAQGGMDKTCGPSAVP